MSEQKYYPEDILVENMENGEYDWLDYVNHHSSEWQNEYSRYCEENCLKSVTNQRPNLYDTRMLNLKLPWKTERHNR